MDNQFRLAAVLLNSLDPFYFAVASLIDLLGTDDDGRRSTLSWAENTAGWSSPSAVDGLSAVGRLHFCAAMHVQSWPEPS